MDDLAGALANGTPAPYGRACTNCARAKCRCIYRVGGPDCERCNRLRKACAPSVSIRKQNGRRSQVSRAAQLEEKLDGLVSMLQNHSATGLQPVLRVAPLLTPPSVSPAAGPVLTGILPCISGPLPDFHFDGPATVDAGFGASVAADHSNALHRGEDTVFFPARTKCDLSKYKALPRGNLLSRVFEPRPAEEPVPDEDPEAIPACEYQPTPLEAQESLETFRERILVFFPFVYLPPSLTAEHLRRSNPFFWFNIMTVTCKDVEKQYAMSDAVWKFVAHKMIVEHEKSLDLLWGLMTLMAWSHYHRKEKPYFSVLVSLAKSLVYDFCLNKPPREPALAICLRKKAEPPPSKEKTTDERRTVLACFYITSQISHIMKRVDALTWTPYMDECLQILSQHPVCDGDELLVALVKIQLLTEQLTRAIWQSPDSVAPAYFSSALKSQLRDLKSQLSSQMQENPIIISHLLFLELSITESVDIKPKGTVSFAPDLQRFENLEASLQTVKKWFENHSSMSSYMYTGLTFMYWCNLGKCLFSLTHLAFEVDDPAWDRRAVKERVDIFGILDQVIQGFDNVSNIRQQEGFRGAEEDIYTRCSKLVRVMKRNWLADTIKMDHRLPTGMAIAPQDTLGGQTDDPLSMPVLQLGSSDDWMSEFFEMNWEP